jgi:regulator of protease activity HflC (stomatin/prohibitin superfamily)
VEPLFQFLITVIDRLFVFTVVEPWQMGVRVTCGRWYKVVGPGIVLRWPILGEVFTVTVPRRTVDLPNQPLETANRVPVEVSGTLVYSIVDVEQAMVKVTNQDESLEASAMAIIARVVNQIHYDELTIDNVVRGCSRLMKNEAKRWGCELHEIGITHLTKQHVIGLINH